MVAPTRRCLSFRMAASSRTGCNPIRHPQCYHTVENTERRWGRGQSLLQEATCPRPQPTTPAMAAWVGGAGRVSTRRTRDPSASDIYICVHGRMGDIQGVVAACCSLGARRVAAMMTWYGSPHPWTYSERTALLNLSAHTCVHVYWTGLDWILGSWMDEWVGWWVDGWRDGLT